MKKGLANKAAAPDGGSPVPFAFLAHCAPPVSRDVKHRMEHQDSVTRPFYGIIAAYSIFLVGCGIYFHEAQVLNWGFGMLLVAMIAWWLLAPPEYSHVLSHFSATCQIDRQTEYERIRSQS